MDISLKDKICGLSLIWRDAEYNFPFWNQLSSLDWDSAYLEFLDAIKDTTCLKDYYLQLMKFISLLNDGHTFVEFPKSIYNETKQFPIKIRYQDGKHIIVALDSRYNIPLLSEVLAIDKVNIDQYLEEQILPYCWHTKKSSSLTNLYSLSHHLRNQGFATNAYSLLSFINNNECIELSTSAGDFTLYRADENLRWNEVKVQQKSVNENCTSLYSSSYLDITVTEDGMGIIILPTFTNDNLPKTFFSLIDKLVDCKGFLIDIRNNDGGNSENADAISQAFIHGEFETGRVKHLIHIGAYWAWGKGMDFGKVDLDDPWMKQVYDVSKKSLFEDTIQTAYFPKCPLTLDQPVVILEDNYTSSSSENLLINFDNINRATIVGTASYGSTGNPLICRLPGGGLYRICTRRYTYPNGKEFIGVGVEPHVEISNSLDDLRNGTDRVFDRGLQVLRERVAISVT